jgi:hypothetical protein
LTYFSGKPAYLAFVGPFDTAFVTEQGHVQATLDPQIVRSAVAEAARPYSIVESRLVTQYEPYYVDREKELRLPALYIRLTDPQGTIFYIDLSDGRVARSYSRWERLDRWLYQGLHDFDLPWLYRYRPLWDVLVIFGLAGGAWLSTTSVIIAWRRIRGATFSIRY